MAKKKLSKYVYAAPPAKEEDKFKMNAKPIVQLKPLRPIIWAYSYVRRALHRGKLTKVNMEGLKAPYVLICNHNAFFDFYVMSTATAPVGGVYPAAVDDFIGREAILRLIGGYPTRKYTNDLSLVRTARKVIKSGNMFGIYAEARYSLCGKTEVIPESVAQLCKFLGAPVVTLKMSGHHIYNPFWNIASYRLMFPTQATMTKIFTGEEVKKASVEEIHEKITSSLANDDFRYQSENRLKLKYKKRAEGLHNILYQCPACGKEHQMDSKGAKVFCKACGKSWTLNYYGELEADKGETEFKFPTDWYDWERTQVRKQIDDGTYYFESECHVNDLPNAKGYIRIGNGRVIHDINGFHVSGVRDYDNEPFEMVIPSAGQYACHVEFNYRYGDYKNCIDLNTMNDTWYVFPYSKEFSGTKVSLAVEEIYKKLAEEKKVEQEGSK